MVRAKLALIAAIFSLSQVAIAVDREAEMADRLKPVGEVCIEGDSCASQVAATASSGPRGGADIYKASCGSCHDAGVAGAPKQGAPADWEARMSKGLDGLTASAIKGINAMPPRGLCMDCSDDEIKATVEYMLEQN